MILDIVLPLEETDKKFASSYTNDGESILNKEKGKNAEEREREKEREKRKVVFIPTM